MATLLYLFAALFLPALTRGDRARRIASTAEAAVAISVLRLWKR
jgi:hypothetical protein